MGSSTTPAAPDPSAEFLAAFRAAADAQGGMTFAQFMELALYHPELGYYRRDRTRVGYARGTDFFTATTSGPIFGELVAAACVKLLGGRQPGDYTFVEIGAEPGASVLNGVQHPFAGQRAVQLGEPIELSGRCVVFSNELFDAQPFHRFVFRRDAWHERGVALRNNALVEFEIPRTSVAQLPATAPEGYVIDAPVEAAALVERIAGQPWSGLFIACDYGKSWRELTEATPGGTGRAYYQHTQSNDLLARPGEQDLTCHVCWDWLINALAQNRFAAPALESQETFFVRHAGEFIAATTAAEAAQFSRKKLALMQLLHPAHLGQKFQVLHAWRD
ncbi:MAG TPA: SAM-dependent methyltransferase [Opitutaceae bacterium]|nr:SAM-dependent methyltransferase [Opitutaceae bacterium]